MLLASDSCFQNFKWLQYMKVFYSLLHKSIFFQTYCENPYRHEKETKLNMLTTYNDSDTK